MSDSIVSLPPGVLAALGKGPAQTLLPLPSVVGSLADVDLRTPGCSTKLVANVQPSKTSEYRLAIIGEAPGAEEDAVGRPFQGQSGRFLDKLLAAHGIDRAACFVGNICNYRPPENQFFKLRWDGPEITESLARLDEDLKIFNPNLCILLGGNPLRAACGETRSIQAWRGSLFRGVVGPFAGRKCLATYHPAAVLRMFEWAPHLRFDLTRARHESTSPSLDLPRRTMRTGLSCDEIIREIESLISAADQAVTEFLDVWVSYDLEGYWNRITRFSIATSPDYGFIVPITRGEYDDHWTLDEEVRIWVAVARLLTHPRIRKVLQNSLYDRFVLAYVYKIVISNVAYDTMCAHWELYAELPNSLAFQASIYTNEPYWKDERENEDLTTKEVYCIKDSCVTEEIRQVQTPLLQAEPHAWNHFRFNMELLNAFLYMELRGLNYDGEAAKDARAKAYMELYTLQHELNVMAGRALPDTLTRNDILQLAKGKVCKIKESPYVVDFAQLPSASRKADLDAATKLAELARLGAFDTTPLPPATLGTVESLLETGLNVDSPKQMVEFLYVERKCERQYKENKDGTKALTADVNALLELYRKTQDPISKLVLRTRSAGYIVQTLGVKADPDGRVRCGYNKTGPETGRVACYESPTGSGYNLQTVTKKLRYLFRADDGHWFFQCDLAGADGWTVAAHCHALGDPTMFDDYMFGLKPARIIAVMYMYAEKEMDFFRAHSHREPNNHEAVQIFDRVSRDINALSRDELKKLCKEVDGDGWLYFGCKRIQHGSNYKAFKNTISKIILKDSYKFIGEPIYVEPNICGRLQDLYFGRYYGVPRWHITTGARVLQTERLSAASGRTRRFFGRLDNARGTVDDEVLRAALSNEPQDNTTFATDLAMHKLWFDRDNRNQRGQFVIEPLHQVHDALNGQFPKEAVEFARNRIPYYFDNEIEIAGMKLKIPYEGAFGPSWGELTEGTL